MMNKGWANDNLKIFSLAFVLLGYGSTFPANVNNCKHFLCYFNAVLTKYDFT